PGPHAQSPASASDHLRPPPPRPVLTRCHPVPISRAAACFAPRCPRSNPPAIPVSPTIDFLREGFAAPSVVPDPQCPKSSVRDVKSRAPEHKLARTRRGPQNDALTRRKNPGRCKLFHPKDNKTA